MPYKSTAQAAYFNIHRKELEKEGVNVDEWNKASKGKHLPHHVSPKPAAKKEGGWSTFLTYIGYNRKGQK